MPGKPKIPGARKTKGRYISGHPLSLEERTFQETQRREAIDRTMRKWRAEPHEPPGPSAQVHHLLARLRDRLAGVDAHLLDVEPLGMERPSKPEPVAPKGPGKTVERSLGGWIYTIAWPGGEILDKRREV